MLPRKGFFVRTAASLIDTAAVIAIGFLFDVFIASNILTEYQGALLTGLFVLAYTLFDVFLAGTPGKLALGLAIGNSNGTPAPRAVLSLRWSTKYFPLICAILFILTNFGLFRVLGGLVELLICIGCLFVLNDDKLAWHDQWAHTAVFSRRQLFHPAQGFPVTPPPTPPNA